jgi:hypothetical protein
MPRVCSASQLEHESRLQPRLEVRVGSRQQASLLCRGRFRPSCTRASQFVRRRVPPSDMDKAPTGRTRPCCSGSRCVDSARRVGVAAEAARRCIDSWTITPANERARQGRPVGPALSAPKELSDRLDSFVARPTTGVTKERESFKVTRRLPQPTVQRLTRMPEWETCWVRTHVEAQLPEHPYKLRNLRWQVRLQR